MLYYGQVHPSAFRIDVTSLRLLQGKSVGRKPNSKTNTRSTALPGSSTAPTPADTRHKLLAINIKPLTELLLNTLEKTYTVLVPEVTSKQRKVEEKHLRVKITAVKTVLNVHKKLIAAEFPFADYFDENALVQLNAVIESLPH